MTFPFHCPSTVFVQLFLADLVVLGSVVLWGSCSQQSVHMRKSAHLIQTTEREWQKMLLHETEMSSQEMPLWEIVLREMTEIPKEQR